MSADTRDSPQIDPAAPPGALARLAPPRFGSPFVERTLVLRSLDIARNGRLTQLIGPAGAGKTVCLAQWHHRLRAAGIPAIWYSAHEREREPAAFARMLARAIHVGGVDLNGTGLLETTDLAPEMALDAILLALERADRTMVLIIDAYERIDGPVINPLVQVLLETAPDAVHLVISARRKPRLAISAMYAQGMARVIETEELRLDRREIAAHLDLADDDPDLDLIAERTEGWPVAVGLYRLWRERAGAGHGVSALFNGQSGELSEYLAEQVFDTLDPELKRLLVDLAVFSEVTAELADHIRGRDDSASQLEALSAALPGLVEHVVDPPTHRYRPHPLLIDYARGRGDSSPTQAALVHRRAADFFAAAQRYPEALAHARATGDGAFQDETAARIAPLRVFLASGASELRAILRELSPADLAAHPRLRLMEALATFKAGFFLDGRAILETVRGATRNFTHDPQGATDALQVEGAALDLLFGCYFEGAELDERPLIATIKARSAGDTLMAAWCENILLTLLSDRGDLAGARQALARCKAIYVSQGMTRFAEFWLLNHHAVLGLAHGTYRQAAELSAAMRRQRRGGLASDVPVLAVAELTAAVCAYERRFTEDAAEWTVKGLELMGDSEMRFEPYAIALPLLAEVAFRRGGAAGLNALLERYDQRARALGIVDVPPLLKTLGITWRLRAGDTVEASELAEPHAGTRKSGAGRTPWRLEDARATALSLWWLGRGDFEQARRYAAALVAAGTEGARLRTRLKGLVLEALALDADGRVEAARHRLETALADAAPEHAVAAFAEEGARLEGMIHAIAADETVPPAARRHAASVQRALAIGRRQSDGLNEREAQIVGYLRDGASNKLIARRMGLTENTIKFHMKRIFAKLGISTRRDAVDAAARLAVSGLQEGPD